MQQPLGDCRDDGGPLVFMRFQPVWAYIDGVRDFGRFWCETTLKRPDVGERSRVVLQEALENAVKYSTPDEAAELELEIQTSEKKVCISITSRPNPAHLDTLREEIALVQSMDPEQAYIAAFLRAASEPDAPGRLGLARMRHEGKFELSLNEEADGRVRVTAVGTL